MTECSEFLFQYVLIYMALLVSFTGTLKGIHTNLI